MDMHLNHIVLQGEAPCGVCKSLFSVEGEVTLPGSLRETTEVLYAAATAAVESAETQQEHLSVTGRVMFCVLYAQGEQHRLDSIEATADFTHLCGMPGAVPQAEVFAHAQVESVQANVQNGRLTMRANIRLCARATVCGQTEALTEVQMPGVQQRTEQIQMRRTTARGNGEALLREEFDLPAELAITDTLGAWATAVFHDAAGGQGRIGLSGEVTLEAVHVSEIPGKPLVVTRHTIPVSQSVEIKGEGGEMLAGRILVKDVAVASQDMGDGERTLRAEVLLGLSAWAESEAAAEVLTDAYTTEGEDLKLTRAPVTLRTGSSSIHAAESGKAALLLAEGAKPIRTMLAAFATPVMTGFSQQGSRLVADGVLTTTLLYMSDDGVSPASAQIEVPFRAAFAAEAAPEDIVLLTASNVEAVPITSDRVELRYILHAQVEGMKTVETTVVTDAAAVPAAAVTQDIVLYFAQPGEGTWDIARRYRISESELRTLNPDLNGGVQAGQGLVVWRKRVM